MHDQGDDPNHVPQNMHTLHPTNSPVRTVAEYSACKSASSDVVGAEVLKPKGAGDVGARDGAVVGLRVGA